VQPWTAHQRLGIGCLVAIIVSITLMRYAFNRLYVSEPQPAHPPREYDLADRIDPNTADLPTLSALPLIGDKKAADIVAFRTRYVASHAGRLPFRRPIDLQLVHGIGTSTVTQLTPYLLFPGSSTTRPAEEK
jgi:DNA uptake protein ComE-like DNA-binding protein